MKVEIIQQKGHNFLWINDYLWMWDVPTEVDMQKKIAVQAYGNVLVAGYGLGIVQKYLMENEMVTSVLTVEKVPEVMNVCIDTYGEIFGAVIIDDFFKFNTSNRYDCVIGDIWHEIAPEALNEYKKFAVKALQLLKPGGLLLGWGIDYFKYLVEKEQKK